jgi:hypothetical protein
MVHLLSIEAGINKTKNDYFGRYQMTAKPLTDIRNNLRTYLRDESLADYDLTDVELDMAINTALTELSESIPLVTRDHVHTTAGTTQIDASAIDELLEVTEVEYPVDLAPASFIGFREMGDIVFLTGGSSPVATEDIYLHCRKVHTLTDSVSTLRPHMERILLQGAAGYAAFAWCNTMRTQVKSAIELVASIDMAISGMSVFITKATDDLTAGRAFINKGSNFGRPEEIYASYAAADLGNVKAKLDQAGGFVKEMAATLSVTAAIKSYEQWASSQITAFKLSLRQNAVPRVGREYSR